MADPGDPLDSSYEPPARQTPWGIMAGVVAFLVFGALTFWITREKKNDDTRKTVMEAMEKELVAEEEAIKTQREKLMDLTRQVESLRSAIQVGQVSNGKASVAQFKQLAAEQRTEREKFAAMADAYNKKVAEYHKLEE